MEILLDSAPPLCYYKGVMKQDLYDVMEVLIRDKEEAIEIIREEVAPLVKAKEFFSGPYHKAYREEFCETVVANLRRFTYRKLELEYDEIMSYIDEELFDTYPEIEFYLAEETYEKDEEIH